MQGGLLLLQASPTSLSISFSSVPSLPWRCSRRSLPPLHLTYPPPVPVRSTSHRHIDHDALDQEEEDVGVVVDDERRQEQDSRGYLSFVSPRNAVSVLRTGIVRALTSIAVSRFNSEDSSKFVSSPKSLFMSPSPHREHSSEYSSWEGGDSPSESSSETSSSIGDDSSVENPRQTLLEVSEEIDASSRETEIEHDTPYVRPGLISPGFSFSAAGFLFPYHIGVARCLIEHGYITENTPLAGSSAGALVSAVIASGLTMDDAMLATKELAADCRKNGTAFRLGMALRRTLDGCLPEDAHIRTSGRIRVAITQVFRSPKALIVGHFDSKKDLIDGLLTSCFIPGYFAPRPVTLYRRRVCVDGGLTQFMPPTSANRTVRVCAFSASKLGLNGVGISPDCSPTRDNASTRQLLSWALEPASDDILDNFYDIGYQDALVWVTESSSKRTMCATPNTSDSMAFVE